LTGGAVMAVRSIVFSLLMLAVASCQSKPPEVAAQHLVPSASGLVQADPVEVAKDPIPDIVRATPFLSKPVESNIAEERYTVVLHDVPVKELLFTLARDSNINIDIHSDIEGNTTINAVDETLANILSRLARQSDFIYEVKDGVLVVRPDTKFWHTYDVDYLNIKRDVTSTMSLSLDSSGDIESDSSAEIKNEMNVNFWEPLVDGINFIIELDIAEREKLAAKREEAKKTVDDEGLDSEDGGDKDAAAEDDAKAEGSDFVVTHQATGTLSVLATSKQHKQIQVFFDQIMSIAQRQVLIEATIVEVQLNDYFQRGIDWYRFTGASSSGTNFGFGDKARLDILTDTDTNFQPGALRAGANPVFALGHKFVTSGSSNILELQMLEEFGDVTVLSSPKVMALNNQTAFMKVIDEILYFTKEVEQEKDDDGNVTSTETTYTPEKGFEGIVMSVTPHINADNVVSLHVRPTISQLIDYKTDGSGATVPYFQVRDMESVLRVPDGQTVVLGGLMKDRVSTKKSGLPGLAKIPLVGAMFETKAREVNKIETAIFFRPTIITPEKLRDEITKTKLSFGAIKSRFGEDDGMKKILKGLRRAEKSIDKWKKSIGLSGTAE
jgi:MSHA biogenesis protein MshL